MPKLSEDPGIGRHVQELEETLKDWRKYREDYSLHDLIEDRHTRNAVLYAMLVAIQTSISIAHHLIVENYLPKPGTYQETFTILRKAELLNGTLAEKMAQLAFYRQQLVHFHRQLNLSEVYDVLRDGLDTLESFAASAKSSS
jgi:uncharacterized protein YutE (UPF0331/DUF86 family)